ncbi:MAG: hypothetical protein ACTSQ7_10670 [Alphaproteobacteria bacterium]
MTNIRTQLQPAILGVAMMAAVLGTVPANAAQRVEVTGEVIDSWCYLTEIMYPEGTAHHQCAIWCAAGGIPVGILADDGTVYIVLKLEDDAASVANPAVMEIQSHRVRIEGELYPRDGINYLVVNRVLGDEGVVKLTHEEYGIQPFGE